LGLLVANDMLQLDLVPAMTRLLTNHVGLVMIFASQTLHAIGVILLGLGGLLVSICSQEQRHTGVSLRILLAYFVAIGVCDRGVCSDGVVLVLPAGGYQAAGCVVYGCLRKSYVV
jgi:hypothetical protein